MLEVDDLHKVYAPPPAFLRPLIRTASSSPVTALRGVSFSVAPGRIVGLVGPNGAGKTTIIKIIATLLEATSGQVRLHGADLGKAPVAARAQTGLVLADERGVYWRLTGRQNLELFGVLAGLSRADARSRAGELLDELDLTDWDKRVFGYSSGMRLRLNLARALIARPGLLVLDEPSRSLDPLASEQIGSMLRRLAAEGTAVLLSSHRLDEVAAVCDDVVAIVEGQVRFDGPTDRLGSSRDTARAIAALLGVEDR